MQYIRDFYGIPIKRGMRVRCFNGFGHITSAKGHVRVRIDGQKHSKSYHPYDLDYFIDGKWVIGQVELNKFNKALAMRWGYESG